VAAFIEDSFQTTDVQFTSGTSLDAGVGVDRKAGDYRISGTLLVHREDVDVEGLGRTDVSLIASADRSFSREKYNVRTFAVITPSESSAFIRAITTVSLRDNLVFEGSGGWFAGSGRDVVGRFAECDFLYTRLKYYF
jgi:hypothetical protein